MELIIAIVLTALLSSAISFCLTKEKYKTVRSTLTAEKMQEAEGKLEKFYSENNITEPTLERVEKALGIIKVEHNPKLKSRARLTECSNNKYEIELKSQLNTIPSRFDIAHECGHLINKDKTLYGVERPTHGQKNEHEQFIDYMAAAILMPENSVAKKLDEKNYFALDKKQKKEIILDMAREYRVDEVTVLRRIYEVRTRALSQDG